MMEFGKSYRQRIRIRIAAIRAIGLASAMYGSAIVVWSGVSEYFPRWFLFVGLALWGIAYLGLTRGTLDEWVEIRRINK